MFSSLITCSQPYYFPLSYRYVQSCFSQFECVFPSLCVLDLFKLAGNCNSQETPPSLFSSVPFPPPLRWKRFICFILPGLNLFSITLCLPSPPPSSPFLLSGRAGGTFYASLYFLPPSFFGDGVYSSPLLVDSTSAPGTASVPYVRFCRILFP